MALTLLPLIAGLSGAVGSNRGDQGSVQGPSTSQSVVDCSFTESAYAVPLCDGVRHAVPLDDMIRAAVIGLLDWSAPSAIVRRVRAVIVNPVERCAFWLRPHVPKEACEVAAPFSAHRNTSPAVKTPRLLLRLVNTSTLSVGPGGVFPCPRLPMTEVGLSRSLSLQAATTSCVATSEAPPTDSYRAATHATALPHRPCQAGTFLGPSAAENRKPSEVLSGDIRAHPHVVDCMPHITIKAIPYANMEVLFWR